MEKPSGTNASVSSPVGLTASDPPAPPNLEAAIVRAVAYVDVFDYPLTAEEAHRYLVGVAETAESVRSLLANGRLVPHRLAHHQGYFTLPGREAIVETRRRRATVARQMWPQALNYGRLIATLPFVRMVAVTGSLAVDNVEPEADIDYLIVTENDRLWLCRAMVIAIVRLAARRGVALCPNYFLARRALGIQSRNLYTARELAQMVPLNGLELYWQMRRANGWTADFLPNANGSPPQASILPPLPGPVRLGRRLAQAALQTPPGARVERWEMQRKIRRFTHQRGPGSNGHDVEAAFHPDWCKGHFDSHGRRIMETFDRQLRQIEGR